MGDVADLRADLRRYRPWEWFLEPSVWALVVYRLGRAARGTPAPLRQGLTLVYVVAHLVVRILSGVNLPRGADVGPGLRIHHGGPVVFAKGARMGAHCDVGHGVTVGMRAGGDVPTIGDRVVLSAYAQVLGAITIGDGTKVGALSVVLHDLPAGVTAAGSPAVVLSERSAGPRRVA